MLALKATPSLQTQARNLWLQIQQAAPRTLDALPRVDVQALTAYQNHFNQRTENLALRLATGEITVNQWRLSMETEIERLHLTGAVIGRGGVDGMSQRDLKPVRRVIGEQKQYLQAWEGELLQQRNRNEDFDPAKIYNRSKLYGGAVNATVNEAQVTALGMPALPFYPAVGTQCRTNCGCTWKIVKLAGNGDWDCFWVRAKDDSCDVCIQREAACNPLRIRKGQIQDFNRAGTMA